jgi:hypothetical protein
MTSQARTWEVVLRSGRHDGPGGAARSVRDVTAGAEEASVEMTPGPFPVHAAAGWRSCPFPGAW